MRRMSSQQNHYKLTPEQLALSLERKEKKARDLAQASASPSPIGTPTSGASSLGTTLARLNEKAKILDRRWMTVEQDDSEYQYKVRFMTWNLLAQALVRRELFPTSGNALKTATREPMIHLEILTRNADIFCLQEVDRTEALFPILKTGGYRHHYSYGPGKKHGCLIGFRESRFKCLGTEQVLYDEQFVHPTSTDNTEARGISFKTTNIGALVKLKDIKHPGRGFVVATTHLFWHPKYTYERSRQLGILLREALKFRATTSEDSASSSVTWPILLAGDLNFAPVDAAYSLLIKDPILPDQEAALQFSRVVHRSIDPSVPDTRPKKGGRTSSKDEDEGGGGEEGGGEGGGEEEQDPDRVIFNARHALPEDGLLATPELADLFSVVKDLSVKSTYHEGLKAIRNRVDAGSEANVKVFGRRADMEEHRQGYFEPEWTSYTHYWKTVLDYVFLIDAPQSRVLSLLEPPTAEQMEPGLPQTGVCGSDHVSLCVEVGWRS